MTKKAKKALLIVIAFGIVLALVFAFVQLYYRYLHKDYYLDLEHISHADVLTQEAEDYYVYFFLAGCPDCNIIRKDIREFAKTVTLFAVDAEEVIQLAPRYDWETHNERYDIEIGVQENNRYVYYDPEYVEQLFSGEVCNEYGWPAVYQEIKADDSYVSKNPSAELGKIYASMISPVVNYNVESSQICVAMYPTLIRVENGVVTECYYDAPFIKPYITQEG